VVEWHEVMSAPGRNAVKPSRRPLLAIYLNDHLAGATGGARLAHRTARSHGDDDTGRRMARLARQIAEDRRSLMRIMADLDVPLRRARIALGALAELAGRLKTNGRAFNRSPLNDVLELEVMLLGVEGKAACWRTLSALVDAEPALDRDRLAELERRAEDQIAVLEEMRAASAGRVMG
jgi:hypothetical protein